MRRRRLQDVQRAVDAQADAPRVLRRFDVDVGRAARRRLAQGFGEERDGGSVVASEAYRRGRVAAGARER